MLYSQEITVAANTTEANASETVIKVTRGVIKKIIYQPRPGHSALCHARVFYQEHQIAPVDRNTDLHGDTFPIEWEEYEELFTDPYELVIRAWNLDDTYSHTFDISFVIMLEEVAQPLDFNKLIKSILNIFSPTRIFGGSS